MLEALDRGRTMVSVVVSKGYGLRVDVDVDVSSAFGEEVLWSGRGLAVWLRRWATSSWGCKGFDRRRSFCRRFWNQIYVTLIRASVGDGLGNGTWTSFSPSPTRLTICALSALSGLEFFWYASSRTVWSWGLRQSARRRRGGKRSVPGSPPLRLHSRGGRGCRGQHGIVMADLKRVLGLIRMGIQSGPVSRRVSHGGGDAKRNASRTREEEEAGRKGRRGSRGEVCAVDMKRVACR